MQVLHSANGRRISVESASPHFLLTNNRDYLALGFPNHSNYDGFFVKSENSFLKTVWNIAPETVPSQMEIDNGVTLSAGETKQHFSLFSDGILMKGKGNFLLTLDCKRLYDESDKGRFYKIENISQNGLSGAVLFDVCYTKYNDDSLSALAYGVRLCIATTMQTQNVGAWRQVSYAYDDRRGTRSTPWVYDALRLTGEGKIAVAYGSSAEDARRKAISLLTQRDEPRDDPALPMHALLAWRSLDALRSTTGILAGLPWFGQEWSRDELIASGGLLAAKKYDALVQIIDKWHSLVNMDGTLPAIYPALGLPSSDAPGWLGKRTHDLLLKLSSENILHKVPQSTIARWRDGTALLIDKCATRIRDGLVWTDANTTWMDTQRNDDGRAGARIEIQALFLALYDAHAYLCTITKTPVDPRRAELARGVVEAVHNRLVSGGMLLDGLHADGALDETPRPNIFLARYVAPRLFTDGEWRKFFAAALPRLWQTWGGLSSIAVDDRNFQPHYTGEDIASYHRGDSWYFVNNIAAMSLFSIDPVGFRVPVKKILDASVRDMLELGFVGHCSELSSAVTQEACGCHAQAWSASALLEALLLIGYE